jgi:alpha-L-fucosidase
LEFEAMAPNSCFSKTTILLLSAAVFGAGILASAPRRALAADVIVDQAATDKAIAAWRDKRFGMFVHWGPVTVAGTEIGWSRGKEVPAEEYDQLYKRFNPTAFDADQWAKLAADTGMKYLVITSKHHDGFCLWPSKYSDYNISNTPFKRDVLKELRVACDAHNVQFCTYFSLLDWHDPDYPLGSPGGSTKKPDANMARFFDLDRNETEELIANYGPLGVMWFDGDWEEPWNQELGARLYVELKKLQPSLLINNRVGKSRPGVAAAGAKRQPNSGDYDTPEQRVGGFDREFPWETCMTICPNWSWHPNDEVKSLKQCLQPLLQTVGGDGNFLFNVGPMPDGQIEPGQVARLKEMGDWMKKYGDGVYGTRGGPFKPGMWGAATCKGDRIYLYVMKWPADGPLRLPAIGARVLDAKTRSGGNAVVKQNGSGVYVDMPAAERDKIATVIEITIDGKAFDIPPIAVDFHSGSLARGKKVTASNVFQKDSMYGAERATDDDDSTRWATDPGQQPTWLEVDLGEPHSIGRVMIDEPAEFARVEKFELQYFDGQGWKTFHAGTRIGPEWSAVVGPVTASRVRLNILRSSDGPTIREFHVYGPSSAEPAASAN